MLVTGAVVLVAGCDAAGGTAPTTSGATSPPGEIDVRSDAFAESATIPARFTCDGQNVSPPLRWTGVPPDARALALVVDDPDAPRGTFVHWVVVDIPPATTGVAENASPDGGTRLRNDAGRIGYFGPCPPTGRHRYRFTVYALPGPLRPDPATSPAAAVAAIERAAVATGRLVGLFR
jgi:Raf kinase inhibitor-like YbhB/YbcL family protein